MNRAPSDLAPLEGFRVSRVLRVSTAVPVVESDTQWVARSIALSLAAAMGD